MSINQEKIAPVEEVEPNYSPKGLTAEDVPNSAVKASDPQTEEEKTLDIWEGLNRTKYANEFFNIRAYEGEFNLKMQTSQIDKYIRQELESRNWVKNTDNWGKVLSELEQEIGSERMNVFERITKITNYIRVLNKINNLNKLKQKYSTL